MCGSSMVPEIKKEKAEKKATPKVEKQPQPVSETIPDFRKERANKREKVAA